MNQPIHKKRFFFNIYLFIHVSVLNMIKLQLKKLVKTEKCEREGIVKNGLGLRGKRYDVHPHLSSTHPFPLQVSALISFDNH